MDELDASIVRLLQSDARLSNRELARRLGVAPSTALERVRALTRRGVIRGYGADVDLKALGRTAEALVSVQLARHQRSIYETFRETVGSWPEVVTLFVVSGGSDIMLHVAVQDSERLHAFLVDRLATRPEVARFNTTMVFDRHHNRVLEPLAEE
ncbi:Lrp/AsnC family transcriptional regulator [Glycomyces sp. NPDC047369]|uniref:DNA-binding Lrp family transcriptional regulator n=1 Tax=Glycomyces artemisiae TaxID=1076443 RepID=A0A2T0U842_9ACTN|nr:Lrp/AsnC family transcriptional regulator [Glycomyces artemisiae]PRY54042.1 DNA-binding Lrp family transcriptional regulator [Glycomyces artemisiae]